VVEIGDATTCILTPVSRLDADTHSAGDGRKDQLWQCNDLIQQQWTDHVMNNTHMFNNLSDPDRARDADTHGNGRNGTKVQLW
jgi:hypothetical protein